MEVLSCSDAHAARIAREDASPHSPNALQRDQEAGKREHPLMSKRGAQTDGETNVQKTGEDKRCASRQQLSGTATRPKLADEVSERTEVGVERASDGEQRKPKNRAHDPAVKAELSWQRNDSAR